MSELQIPDAACDAALAADDVPPWAGQDIDAILCASAPVIVAVELRRLADDVGRGYTAAVLRARADELDGGSA